MRADTLVPLQRGGAQWVGGKAGHVGREQWFSARSPGEAWASFGAGGEVRAVPTASPRFHLSPVSGA